MAAQAMSEMMEDYGWNLVALGRKASSHSGRKTGVSVLDALTEGRSRSQIMEWMLVTDVSLVAATVNESTWSQLLLPRWLTG